MSIRCDRKSVSDDVPGQLQFRSVWTSDQPGGESARFEVRLSTASRFRFRVEGAETTVIRAVQRTIEAGTVVDISTEYINTVPDANKRLALFVFCGIGEDQNGIEVEVTAKFGKYLR